MKSIIALVVFGLLLTFVQCRQKTNEAKYEIKQGGIFNGGRSYDIKSKENAAGSFSIKNDLFSIGQKLILLQNGKERYIVKHELLHLMSTWIITDAVTGQELGKVKNTVELIGSEMIAEGEFGRYKIEGHFRNRSFEIKKDGRKVAKIEKERFHIHDTYDLTVYGDTDQALMVLFTIIVDEIREH